MVKVSIIVPVYNVEEYLTECLESILKQSLKDIEIICVNDGSTDNSLKILQEYAMEDDRIIILNQTNGGYGKAMNVGLDNATGEYIGIVEPDDFVFINMYEELYFIAKKNQLDFVKADFYRFTREKHGNMYLFYNHLSSRNEDYNIVFDPSHTPDAIRFTLNTWSGIYRRDFLEEYHIRHHETLGASFQDNGFFFQTFIYAKRAMIVDTPFYMNRRDNPNSSMHNQGKVYSMNAEMDYIRRIMVQDPEIWERFKGMYWYKKYYNYLGTVKRIGDEYRKEYIQRFRAEFKRGMDTNEVDRSLFSKKTQKMLDKLIKNPDGFYQTVIDTLDTDNLPTSEKKLVRENKKLKKENEELRKEIDKIRNSNSFRVGYKLLTIPRKMRQMLTK